MSTVDHYIAAATRANTRRSYRSAVEHYESEWQGFLPATADSLARYLTAYAGQLSINTLKLRLAGLAQWHIEQGFPDPTKAPMVRKVLKGIRELHPEQAKQATPLQLHQLEQVEAWLSHQEANAKAIGDQATLIRSRRDKALLLLGFWRAFRSDELCRLQLENSEIVPGQGLELYLPRSKGDRRSDGTRYKVPALKRLCPVIAYQRWMEVVGRSEGPVFCAIDRWGKVSDRPLHPNSVIPLLRELLRKSGIEGSEQYSSHSLRRGFATWASMNGWDMKALMTYVGWHDVKSALRYVDVTTPFGDSMASSVTPVITQE